VVAVGTNKQVVLDHAEPLDTSSGSTSQAKFLDRVSHRVREIINATPDLRENLVSIGITLPGLINSTDGIWLNGLQIPGIHQFDLGSYLKTQFDIPYVIEDVSRALTYYEKMAGSGVGVDHFVLLSLGLGTGSGIIIDGKLYQGFNGLAGEIGHTVVQPNGYLDITGMAGTLETVASVSGMQRLFRDRLSEGVASSLQDGRSDGEGTPTLDRIAEAAAAGDRLAKGILFEIGGYVGEACTKIIKLFNPRKLIISGPVSTLHVHMQDAIRQTIEHKVLPEMLSGFTLEFAEYESNQEAQGMALVAMSRYLSGTFVKGE
jgi:N-acetylglucosamine repressor